MWQCDDMIITDAKQRTMITTMNQVQSTLQTWGEKITEALKAAIPAQKDSSGMQKQSIGFSIKYAGYPIVFELKLADYYKFIDEGRKPGHFPPPELLKAWIISKQLNINRLSTMKRSLKKLKSISSNQNRINELCFLIGRKIARNGIPATNFYSNTITVDVLTELQNNLSIAFKQDVIVMLNTMQ